MPGPRGRRTQAERVEATENALYDAAIKLIAREGTGKLTLARIAREAGVSPGLVNHRFGSKTQLLQNTCMKVLEAWSPRLVDAADQPLSGVDRLESLCRFYLQGIASRSELVLAQGRLMAESVSSLSELQPTFRDYNTKVCQLIVEILKPAQEAGEIRRDVDLEAFSLMFIGMLRGISMLYLVNEAVNLDSACEMIINTCRQVLVDLDNPD